MNNIERQVAQLLKDYKINFQSVFVRLDDKGDWKCYQFTCVLGGETFEFNKGTGWGATRGELHQLANRTGCYNAVNKWLTNKGVNTKNKEEYERLPDGGIVIKPNAAELIHCLLMDSDLASGTFEDFCCNMGYDTDSRKALETYLECQKSGDKLRKVLGTDLIELLRVVLEEY